MKELTFSLANQLELLQTECITTCSRKSSSTLSLTASFSLSLAIVSTLGPTLAVLTMKVIHSNTYMFGLR